jgi:hypothetical protein
MSSATPTPLRAAMEARDESAVKAALAPDVILHSPILDTPFRGRDEVGDLLGVVLQVIGPLTYLADVPGDPHVLFFRTDVDGVELEGVDVLRFDQQGLVREITVLLRPFPGVAAFLKATGPKLARRRKGAVQAAATRAATPPLSALMRLATAVTPRLLGLGRKRT